MSTPTPIDYLDSNYSVLTKEDIIIYNPNCVSRMTRILMA